MEGEKKNSAYSDRKTRQHKKFYPRVINLPNDELILLSKKVKGKVFPLQARCGPEGG